MDSSDPEAVEKMSNSWGTLFWLTALVEKDRLSGWFAVPASLSTSWLSLYWDIPGTRGRALHFFCPAALEDAKLRKIRGVFLGSVLFCSDALPVADSFNWMLDQLSVEKSTRACPKRPLRTRLAVHFAFVGRSYHTTCELDSQANSPRPFGAIPCRFFDRQLVQHSVKRVYNR